MGEFHQLGWDALNPKTLFDESELLKENFTMLCQNVLSEDKLEIISAEDAKKSDVKNLQKGAENCSPGKPLVIIDF